MTAGGGTALRGGAITLLSQWSKLLAQLIGLTVLSRIVEPSEFGKYAMILALAGVASIIADFGFSLGAIRATNLSHAEASNLFWINSAVGAVASCGFYFSAGLIADFYEVPELAPAVETLSVMFLLNGLAVQHKAQLNRDLRFGSLALVEAGGQLVGVASAVAFALLGAGLTALVLQQLMTSAATLLLALVCATWLPGLPSLRTPMKSFVRFGATTTLTQAFNYASSNTDNVVIGRLWGSASLGVYSRAFQIFALPLQQLAAPLTRVALPILSRASDAEQFEHRVVTAHRLLSYVLLLALAFIAGGASPLVGILLGAGWEAAPLYLQILAVGGVFQVLGYVYYWVFLAKAKMRVLLMCEGGGRVLMVLVILLAAPLGTPAVAVAYSTGLFLIWLVTTLFGARPAGLSRRRLANASAGPIILSVGWGVGGGVVVEQVSVWGGSTFVQLTVFLLTFVVLIALSSLLHRYRNDYRFLLRTIRRVVGNREGAPG